MRLEGPADGDDLIPSGIPPDMVVISCKAKVGDEQVLVQDRMLEVVWNDPAAREAAEKFLRRKLMDAVLEKWTPVIKVSRS